MTQYEAARKIIEREGNCTGIDCGFCPAFYWAVNFNCGELSNLKEWLEQWLKRNPETEEVKK